MSRSESNEKKEREIERWSVMNGHCRAGIKRVEAIPTGRNHRDRGRDLQTFKPWNLRRANDGPSSTLPSSLPFSVPHTSGRLCLPSFHPHPFLNQSLVIKTFRNVSLSGVRNSPMVQRASLIPSQPLSKLILSCVFLLMQNPPDLR